MKGPLATGRDSNPLLHDYRSCALPIELPDGCRSPALAFPNTHRRAMHSRSVRAGPASRCDPHRRGTGSTGTSVRTSTPAPSAAGPSQPVRRAASETRPRTRTRILSVSAGTEAKKKPRTTVSVRGFLAAGRHESTGALTLVDPPYPSFSRRRTIALDANAGRCTGAPRHASTGRAGATGCGSGYLWAGVFTRRRILQRRIGLSTPNCRHDTGRRIRSHAPAG